ncbi:MAG TPA: hypothetical protein VGJ70_21525, partial [Solirubrobacteraceae bacterium]
VATLETFSATALPTIDIQPGATHLDGARKGMVLAQFRSALEGQRTAVLAYIDPLTDADLQGRQARIPLFKQILQQEETPIATYVGALFDYHWNDHAGQLAKIRRAAGLAEAK